MEKSPIDRAKDMLSENRETDKNVQANAERDERDGRILAASI
jgi:hypothetical protein